MAHTADMGAGDSKLNGSTGLNPVGLGMVPFNTQAIHQRHAFTIPNIGFCFRKTHPGLVRADEFKSRTSRCHDNFCGSLRFKGGKTNLI